jgi:hypothetical protein
MVDFATATGSSTNNSAGAARGNGLGADVESPASFQSRTPIQNTTETEGSDKSFDKIGSGKVSLDELKQRSNRRERPMQSYLRLVSSNDEPTIQLGDDRKEEGELINAPKTTKLLNAALIEARSEAPAVVPEIEHCVRRVKGEVTRVPDPPARLSDIQLKEFQAYAKAHPWEAKHKFTASEFIRERYKKWLGKRDEQGNWIGAALWREDIADTQVEPKLAAAYSTEVRRHPERAVDGIYVRPHKLPEGAKRAVSARLVSELSPDELDQKRERERQKKGRSREQKRYTPRKLGP